MWPGKDSLQMGGLCALFGAFVALNIVPVLQGHDWKLLFISMTVASFFTGALAWRWLIVRPQRYSSRRGALVGALCGAVAHYLCWLVVGVGQTYETSQLFNPIEFLLAAVGSSVVSLMVVGWVTIPIGALLGAALARRQRGTRSTPSTPQTP